MPDYIVGETVRVISGPFEGELGLIESIPGLGFGDKTWYRLSFPHLPERTTTCLGDFSRYSTFTHFDREIAKQDNS